MSFATVDGIELYYERHGDGGEPLVLVHGYTGDVTDWRHQIAEFSRTHRVLMHDNRGHGRSFAPADDDAYSIGRMAEDALGVAGQVGFERFHLLGHSMGGAIAQEMALLAPERLLSLTLEDTSYCFSNQQLGAPRKPPQLSPVRLEEIMARLSRMTPEVLRACWRALARWDGIEQRAGAIRTPTLILYGEYDTAGLVEGSRRLAELIRDSELCEIAGAVHSPQEERPEAFNAALRAFLERHRSA
jgi:pimeloyl-ACP methyl ester carboxylesterase